MRALLWALPDVLRLGGLAVLAAVCWHVLTVMVRRVPADACPEHVEHRRSAADYSPAEHRDDYDGGMPGGTR